jgi:soluble calcium-activated nucleotidase 1
LNSSLETSSHSQPTQPARRVIPTPPSSGQTQAPSSLLLWAQQNQTKSKVSPVKNTNNYTKKSQFPFRTQSGLTTISNVNSNSNISINMARSESFAYANSAPNFMSTFLFYFRSHSTAVTATIGFLFFILLVTSDAIMKGGEGGQSNLRSKSSKSLYWGGAAHPGYFKPKDAILPESTFTFAAVTDMDQLSRLPGDKPKFHSKLMPGYLKFESKLNKYTVKFEEARELESAHNEAGRGMELSELTLYQDRLLAFDDRTGSIFEVLSKSDSESSVVPRFVITEGEGDTDKGMKWEWATEKNGDLYIGSMGKEYTAPDGTIVNTNNLWIAIVNGKGEVKRVDWSREYTFVREQLGAAAPGYVIHEAVLWSQKLKKWVFIPRRVSSEMYDEVKDEKMGTNKVLLVDENFTDAKLVEIQMSEVDPLHGFSTAAFVPNTNERHIMAIRSVEEDCVGGDESLCKQRSYAIVFDVLTGEVLMDEVLMDDNVKYEGIEFVNINTYPQLA